MTTKAEINKILADMVLNNIVKGKSNPDEVAILEALAKTEIEPKDVRKVLSNVLSEQVKTQYGLKGTGIDDIREYLYQASGKEIPIIESRSIEGLGAYDPNTGEILINPDIHKAEGYSSLGTGVHEGGHYSTLKPKIDQFKVTDEELMLFEKAKNKQKVKDIINNTLHKRATGILTSEGLPYDKMTPAKLRDIELFRNTVPKELQHLSQPLENTVRHMPKLYPNPGNFELSEVARIARKEPAKRFGRLIKSLGPVGAVLGTGLALSHPEGAVAGVIDDVVPGGLEGIGVDSDVVDRAESRFGDVKEKERVQFRKLQRLLKE